ncbi:MAG TPA: CPBP family intramembrane glutamic endopeptidase [Bryobacteraceae bacterium]|nr:CPBP family intramembrane glutamic endopeptidase [Bryobacteraceae bacterium]
MRQFLTTLVVVWTAASIAAYIYSQQQGIPSWVALAVTPAFLVEIAFYIAPGFAEVRAGFERAIPRPLRALLLAFSAVIPYSIEAPFTGTFSSQFFFALLGVALVVCFWYIGMSPSFLYDLSFLVFMAAVYLSKSLDRGYGHPAPHVALAILGQLMWIRLGLMTVLSIRGMPNVQFGFVPRAREWRLGIQFYFLFLPVGVALAYLLKFVHFHPQQLEWWKFALLLIGTFLAFLWVVALAEEFFFRAFLQTSLAKQFRSETAGLILASVLFGLAHLWFRAFPNWRFAIVGGAAGVFYGLAFLKSRSIRASMVTHALVVTTWRMFFVS